MFDQNMKKISLLFILLFIFSSSYSQKNRKLYREKFTQGNYLMLENNYVLALSSFKEAYLIDSTSANINYKLGLCYLESSSEKNKAVYHLEKAVKKVTHNYLPEDVTEKRASDFSFYSLAEAYRLNYNFTASNFYFNKFKELVGKKNSELTAEIELDLTINANAEEFTKDTAKVVITNLGDNVNSIFPDYNPLISADESTLIFTSRRSGGIGEEKTDDDQFLEDIYVSYKKNDGTYTTAKSIGININTILNETCIGLSPDGRQLFVYKDINGGDIYYSNLIGDTWSNLTPLSSVINSPFCENHASISLDGKTLYFVSNRKIGGFGGRDIWSCAKLPNGQWGLPNNLGPTINTTADEDAPCIHPDGVTLFFSSKGHKNMGGFDIFKSTKSVDGKWNEPENLRAHINTPDDDMFYVQSVDGKRGYLSSSRIGSYKDKDIYRIDFEQSITQPLVILRGILKFDSITNVPANARINVTDSASNQLIQEIKPNELTGKFIMILAPDSKGITYNITFEADGYKTASTSLVIPPNASYQEIEKEFLLQMINLEKQTLGTIEFIGKIKNKDEQPIQGATISITDNLSGTIVETFNTSANGSFLFNLIKNHNYTISYDAKGYLFNSENINIAQNDTTPIQKEVVLEKIEIGSKIILNNIFFDFNKSLLRKESNFEIDKIVKLMLENPELLIEVSGHTDSKGPAAANLKLSKLRANAVVNAIRKKGINKARLVSKGFGKTRPIATNKLPNGKPNIKGMRENRRVELKIIPKK